MNVRHIFVWLPLSKFFAIAFTNKSLILAFPAQNRQNKILNYSSCVVRQLQLFLEQKADPNFLNALNNCSPVCLAISCNETPSIFLTYRFALYLRSSSMSFSFPVNQWTYIKLKYYWKRFCQSWCWLVVLWLIWNLPLRRAKCRGISSLLLKFTLAPDSSRSFAISILSWRQK